MSRSALPRAREVLSWSLVALAAGCAHGDTVRTAAPLRLRCDGRTGLVRPLPACSRTRPCVRARVHTRGRLVRRTLTAAVTVPTCQTGDSSRAFFDDGAPLSWQDPRGATRYACVYRPPGTSRAAPRPLVVWLHAAGGGADALYDETSLRAKAPSFPLGAGAHAGFVLAALQGRNLHDPTGREEGPRFDHDYRRTEDHPDVAALDHLVDALASDGGIDPRRVYVMGWSNGGRFAELYALLRHAAPTPGGLRVAAGSAYAAGDPFEPSTQGQRPPCGMERYPRSSVPLQLVARACDAVVPCNRTQRLRLGNGTVRDTGQWLIRLQTWVGAPEVSVQLLDERGSAVSACDPSCNVASGERNHARWPDGVTDVDRHDWEPEMLDFLQRHPLP